MYDLALYRLGGISNFLQIIMNQFVIRVLLFKRKMAVTKEVRVRTISVFFDNPYNESL